MGAQIHLDQFRGKTLLMTFIYTRCPLPNFCPLVTHNFAVINQQLAADPALYAKTHLLCVSFDPEHDTPERLRAYGAQYIGSDAKNAFAHWDFAVPDEAGAAGDGEVFRCGHYARGQTTRSRTRFQHADRRRMAKWRSFIPATSGRRSQVVADVKKRSQRLATSFQRVDQRFAFACRSHFKLASEKARRER